MANRTTLVQSALKPTSFPGNGSTSHRPICFRGKAFCFNDSNPRTPLAAQHIFATESE
ncbi:unnamed protein product [Dovyalis caffra]|uniref:Uncharacterized protein n=1 Tax=Dovyalis caffra TaxID=77055 RepID=A0AAV1SQW0_9ROSI|nr:unnamed protein product [Dovyalis caffra]